MKSKRVLYRSKDYKRYLYGGFVSVIMGLSYVLFLDKIMGYFFIAYGVLFIYAYYNSKNNSYIQFDEDGFHVKRLWAKKRIEWKDLSGMRFLVGEIRVFSDSKKIDINKEFLQASDIKTVEENIKVHLPHNLNAVR